MTHRVLVIGVGSIGERHLRCFLQTGRAQLALVEVNAELRQQVAGRYGVSQVFASLDDALRQPPDVAVVAVPAHLHVPFAHRLVEAGVHVLIEKPLSTSLAGITDLQTFLAEKPRQVGLAYVYRCNPVLQQVRQVLQEGRFGRPVQVAAVSGQNFPFYRPAYRDIYYARRETGGGAIQDALTHVLNAAEWLVGPLHKLCADADHLLLEGVAVEDTVHVLARHRGNGGDVLGSYSLNQHQAANESSFTVVCERGIVRAELHKSRWRWQTDPADHWHDEPVPALERDALFVAQANAFLDAVEGHRPVTCSLDEGVQTLKVNLAVLASVDEGCWQIIE